MAIMPTDSFEKNEYMAKLRLVKSQKEEINTLKQEINSIREDVVDIKNLLRELIVKGQ